VLPLFRRVDAWMSRFAKYKPLLERVVVTVRQLINHFSLVGALSATNASYSLSHAVKEMLRAQQAANTLAFGSYASGLSCMSPGSTSTEIFELMWDIFFIAFILESLLFLIWFRRAAVTATVALFLSHLAYSPLAEASAKLLALCDTYTFTLSRDHLLGITPQNANQTRTIRLLSSDYSQDCDAPSFSSFRTGAAVSLVLFSLALPVVVLLIHRVFTLKRWIMARDEILCFLTKHYKQEAWWWETVIMMRKLAIALIVGVLPTVSALQLQLFTVVCLIVLVMSLKYQPLQSVTANRSDQLSISSAILCATLMSVSNAFSDAFAVQIFVATMIFLTQFSSVIMIVFFGGSDDESDEKLFSFFDRVCCCFKKRDALDEEKEESLIITKEDGESRSSLVVSIDYGTQKELPNSKSNFSPKEIDETAIEALRKERQSFETKLRESNLALEQEKKLNREKQQALQKANHEIEELKRKLEESVAAQKQLESEQLHNHVQDTEHET
jgi:hypothetical protein